MRKIIIILSIVVSLIFTSFAMFLIFGESAIYTVLNNQKKEYEEAQDYEIKHRQIYDTDQEVIMPTKQEMVSMGMSYDEAAVMAAISQIIGGYTPESVAKFLGIPNGTKAYTIWEFMAVSICGYLKYDIGAGVTVAQAALEHGWDSFPTTGKHPKAWYWKNGWGVKVGSGEPNEYWDGSGVTTGTHEYEGGNKVSISADFRKYKSFWHAALDHGRLLNTSRYKSKGVPGTTEPNEYALKLGLAGYYTLGSSNYGKLLVGIYEGSNMQKIDQLALQVKEMMSRNGGAHLTPNGTQIPGGEWLPNNSATTGMGNLSIQNKYITNTANYQKGKNRSIQYIVIHDTANYSRGADTYMHYNYFQTNTRHASAHYGVDDKSIVRYVRDEDIAYHAGGGHPTYKNSNSIGIEMCVNEGNDYRTTVQKTLYLTVALMKKYNIPPSNVIRHYDVTRKICPGSMSNDGWRLWNQFKSDLTYLYNATNGTGSNSSAVGSINMGTLNGKMVKAEITGYYPKNDSLQGGTKDAMGNTLNPDNRTCAAPKEIPLGTSIQIFDTGTKFDGQVFKVTDRGGAIKVLPGGVYRIDILCHDRDEAYNEVGRRKNARIIIGDNTGYSKPNNGGSSSGGKVTVTGDGRAMAMGVGVDYDSLPAARKAILDVAAKQLGKPYLWGATGPSKFDCSGLVQFVYKNALGIAPPRNSRAQASWNKVRTVSEDQARPGDLVYHPGHIMIFLKKSDTPGKPWVIHAPQTGDVVKVSKASGKNNTIRQLK